VEAVLGPGGRLAEGWVGYEYRQGQLDMARETARAFEESDTAVIEAGTGTGKTLAYLVPALMSGLKTVISTNTKNLQEQIFRKDLPFIRKHLGGGFRAAYLKGRENYLCVYLYKQFLREPAFAAVTEAVYLDRLKEWAGETRTGDRAELLDFPEDFQTWSDVSAPGERCLGGKCPDFEACYLQKARRAAAGAELVIVNHHLFLADLAIRDAGPGEVIPSYEAVVFDEAHHVEDVATQYFGRVMSSWRLIRLRQDIERTMAGRGKMPASLGRSLVGLGHQADVLAGKFILTGDEVELWKDDDPTMDCLREHGGNILNNLGKIASLVEKRASGEEEIQALAQRTHMMGDDLAFILEGRESTYVYWAQRRGRGLFLRASPIEVSSFLHSGLYERRIPLVFTSATLTTQNSFDYFKGRLGLLSEVQGVTAPSPYDFGRQALLYVPKMFPFPQNPNYQRMLVTEIERILEISRGRAFVLFTSYRNLNHAAEALARKSPWTLLVQGTAPRNALLDRFQRETESVLLATQSFWQGVDVPGESLSAVIIDKLPFPRPDRPLIRARGARVEAEGGDSFFDYMVPEAIISLKQGLGRLIRSASDRGLLAVLDSRLATKGYGKRILRSLPGYRLTHEFGDIAEFFENHSTNFSGA
jgi:ATP-dependent DNA helicase DinG